MKTKYGTQESVDISNPAPLTQEVCEAAALAYMNRGRDVDGYTVRGQWRPLKVLFVGDEPSSRNVNTTVPLVGTSSYKRLLKWIGELDLDIQDVGLLNKKDEILLYGNEYDVVIFLGKKAECVIRVFSRGQVDYSPTLSFLPRFRVIDHPSPRNRKFNDPKYETKMLAELKRWLYE